MATIETKEVLPPTLNSTSNPPPLFDGTTRLYIAYICPWAQRVWIARNYKGLQDEIKLVPIDLLDKPAWYKDVYPPAKVPALEHNIEVKGESLDLLEYLDTHFQGPKLFSDDPAKKEVTKEMLAYSGAFGGAVISHMKGGPDTEMIAAFNKLEEALSKFDDGPFFLGRQFSAVDIALAPFIERYQAALPDFENDEITSRMPKVAAWIEELNKIDAYKQTKRDVNELRAIFKKHLLGK